MIGKLLCPVLIILIWGSSEGLVKLELILYHTASFWNIIIQWTSHDDLTEKSAETFFILQYSDPKEKTCQMIEIQNCTLQFDRKAASVEFCQHAVLDWDFKSIWKPNPCMDPLEKKNSICQFLFYFLQIKLLSLWMASISHNLDKFWFVFWDKV